MFVGPRAGFRLYSVRQLGIFAAMLENIRIVLVETSHPGNIGATARAMMNMGLEHLYLVQPKKFPAADATARASGATGILTRAVVCEDLDQAIADCACVYGASARLRSLPWPVVEPRECAAQALAEAAGGPVALVFGREHSGLTNEELERCQALVNIPTNPKFSSLNVAAAVQVLAYELRLAARAASGGDAPSFEAGDEPASAEDMAGLYTHLERGLVELDFLDPDNPRQLMRRLKRLFNRARLERTEVNILRGILTAATKAARRD